MKKHEPTGRQYSKKEVTSFGCNDTWHDVFITLSKKRGYFSFKEWLPTARKEAQDFLKDKGLPYAPRMYCTKIGPPPEWSTDELKTCEYIYSLRLSEYLKKFKDCKEDYFEDLAARIIELIHKLQSKEFQEKSSFHDIMEVAYELGRTFTLFGIYDIQSESLRQKGEGNKSVFTPYIKKLSKQDGKPHELWPRFINMLKNDRRDPDVNGRISLEAFNDKDELKPLTYKTFSNRIREERKKE